MTHHESQYAVGFDNSPDAHRALAWAAKHAQAAGANLRVVIARGDLHTLSDWADEWTRGLADEWSVNATKELAELGYDLTDIEPNIDIVARDGRGADVLIRESADVDLMVLGSKGHSLVARVVQGSVSQHVSRYAACPVVVVRESETPDSERIVVGIDGSETSQRAVGFALKVAHDTGKRVVAIHSRSERRAILATSGLEPDAQLVAELEAEEASLLSGLIPLQQSHADVEFTIEHHDESPEESLTRASREASMVVVGTRGRGAFAGLLLGSVSTHVLREARCPVAVVR